MAKATRHLQAVLQHQRKYRQKSKLQNKIKQTPYFKWDSSKNKIAEFTKTK